MENALQYVESSHAPYQRIRFFLYIFVNLESCLLVFGNWFGITETATVRKVKSKKKCTKTAKELKDDQHGIFIPNQLFCSISDGIKLIFKFFQGNGVLA
jgi:hypothetical protein